MQMSVVILRAMNLSEIMRNPPDLRPYAHAIADKAIAAYEAMSDKTRPLVLIFSEDHFYVSHKIIQMLTIEEITRRGYSFALGMETPHDAIGKGFLKMFGDKLDAAQSQKIFALAEGVSQGVKAPALMLASVFTQREHYPLILASEFGFWRAMAYAKMPVALNDGSKIHISDNYDILDLNDAQTARAAQKIHPGATEIDASGADGIHARNILLFEKSAQHAREVKPQIYGIRTGGLHAAGLRGYFNEKANVRRILSYEKSIEGLARSAGFSTVLTPLLKELSSLKNIPYEHEDHEIVRGPYPPEEPFRICVEIDKILMKNSELTGIYEGPDLLQVLASGSGIQLSNDDVAEFMYECEMEMRETFEAWVDEISDAPSAP